MTRVRYMSFFVEKNKLLDHEQFYTPALNFDDYWLNFTRSGYNLTRNTNITRNIEEDALEAHDVHSSDVFSISLKNGIVKFKTCNLYFGISIDIIKVLYKKGFNTYKMMFNTEEDGRNEIILHLMIDSGYRIERTYMFRFHNNSIMAFNISKDSFLIKKEYDDFIKLLLEDYYDI